ncbi:MAG: PLP-dependent aspartate aminotransferase family protein [Planctomycetota bacterium]
MTSADPETILARHGAIEDDPHAATSPPLYQTATFGQSRADGFDAFDYTRTDNPTRAALESLLADLEGAPHALTYASGMAAIASVLRLARPGERVLCGRDLYGGTQRFLHRYLEGVEAEHVDLARSEDGRCPALEAALAEGGARLVLVETPSNPRLDVTCLRSVCRSAHAAGALVVVDGTAATPWLQRPLEHGVDVVLHSATKGLSGHGDVTAGIVATRDAALFTELAARRNAEGNALAPFEAWLLLRGVRTLGVRVERAQETALEIARWLESREGVTAVHYPGLASHPGHAVHASQADGAGVLVSFRAESAERARRACEDTRRFTTAVSFGGVASSISIPHHMSHASVPPGAAPPPEPELVRLSIGLESAADLIADLDAALGPPPDGSPEAETSSAATVSLHA